MSEHTSCRPERATHLIHVVLSEHTSYTCRPERAPASRRTSHPPPTHRNNVRCGYMGVRLYVNLPQQRTLRQHKRTFVRIPMHHLCMRVHTCIHIPRPPHTHTAITYAAAAQAYVCACIYPRNRWPPLQPLRQRRLASPEGALASRPCALASQAGRPLDDLGR